MEREDVVDLPLISLVGFLGVSPDLLGLSWGSYVLYRISSTHILVVEFPPRMLRVSSFSSATARI